ncbi:MAG: 4Fe-4S dicluster domain-containing protein [Chloroflexi bacterium]|nr:4Fe-4S dicluster domain-containing protein [Chloroflexota bacterium]
MQIGFYFDQTRCVACDVCVVACKDWHDVPAGPASWRKVTTIEKGKFPNLFVTFLATSCYHCAEPACVAACPSGAITKRAEDGIVVVDREKCWGRDQCDLCLQACPYQTPQFGAEPNAKMQKCDLCLDRLGEGKEPICVASCPLRALDAGPLEELKKRYGQEREAEGFICFSKTNPSIVFKPKVSGALPSP